MFPYNRMKKEKKRQTKIKTDKKKVIYNCEKCNLVLDRDINASINIYKNRILSRK